MIIYIAHQLSAPTQEGIETNRANAAKWVAWVARKHAPIATWITLSGEWTEQEGRARGLEIDCTLIERCDQVWLVGPRLSRGMLVEARHALKVGVPVYFDWLGRVFPPEEPPDEATVLADERLLRSLAEQYGIKGGDGG